MRKINKRCGVINQVQLFVVAYSHKSKFQLREREKAKFYLLCLNFVVVVVVLLAVDVVVKIGDVGELFSDVN